jgi:hypothetical protein
MANVGLNVSAKNSSDDGAPDTLRSNIALNLLWFLISSVIL